MQTNKIALIAGGFLVVLLGAGFFLWRGTVGEGLVSNPFPIVSLNGTTTENGSPDGANTVEVGSAPVGVPQPSLERVIPVASPDLSATAREVTVKYLNTSVENLRKDPLAYQDWVNLGLARQMLGDYAGAEEVWVYATKLSPTTSIAFSNLGYLYMVYIKNGAKSEASYKQALTLNSKDTNSYRSLAELYTYHYKKDTSAVEIILKEGILKNPDAYDLGVLLARYYVEKGMIAEAKTVYTAAASSARSAGKVDVATSIETERDALK